MGEGAFEKTWDTFCHMPSLKCWIPGYVQVFSEVCLNYWVNERTYTVSPECRILYLQAYNFSHELVTSELKLSVQLFYSRKRCFWFVSRMYRVNYFVIFVRLLYQFTSKNMYNKLIWVSDDAIRCCCYYLQNIVVTFHCCNFIVRYYFLFIINALLQVVLINVHGICQTP